MAKKTTRSIDDFDDLDDDDFDVSYKSFFSKEDRVKAKIAVDKILAKMNSQTTSLDSILNTQKEIGKIYKQTLNLNLAKDKGLYNKISKQLKEYVDQGFDINKLNTDINEKLKFNIKLIDDYTKNAKFSNKKAEELKNVIFAQYEIEKKQLEIDKKTKSQKETLSDKFDSIIESIPIGGQFGIGLKESLTKRKESVVGGLSEGNTNLLTKAIEKFAKFPILFGAAATAIGFIVNRLFKLVSAELELNSQIVKGTGLRAASALKIQGQISSARESLKLFYSGDIEQAQQKAIEGASAILNVFGRTKYVTNKSIIDIVSFSEKINVSAEEAAKFFASMQFSLGMTTEQSEEFAKYIQIASENTGVSLRDITKDIQENMEFASIYAKGFSTGLVNAAIESKLIGSNLKELGDFSRKFLTIDEAFQNVRTLSILTGKQYNALEFITTARFGGPEKQLAQRNRILDDLIKKQKDGYDIAKDAYLLEVAKNAIGVDSAETLKREINLRKIRLGDKSVDEEFKKAEKRRLQLEKKRGTITSYAESLGILELKTPGDLVLAKILTAIDTKLVPAAETIANVVKGIFEFMLNPEKFLEEFTKEGKMLDDYRDFVNKYSLGLIDVLSGRGTSQYVHDINKKRSEEEKSALSRTTQKSYNTMTTHALGGIVSRPSIAGEAGPEAILPLTGPGKESFTKPFLDKVASENNKQVLEQLKELNSNFKELIKKKITIENKMYMESRKIAESLTETALLTA